MSVARRDVLIGAAGMAAAGLAWKLTPREALDLSGGTAIRDIVPGRFGAWSSRVSGELVQPKTEGTLAATLYSDMLTRIYTSSRTGAEVMVLMAYGSTQSDLLQLHRPETCYPAFGYKIRHSAVARIGHRRGVVPVRELVAEGPARAESILYWTRIGDALPTSGAEQRRDKLRMAMAGYVPDGLLARFSIAGAEECDFAQLAGFAAALLDAVPGQWLGALVGRGR